VTIRRRPNDRFPSPNGDLRICLDLHLRIWKAGWVQALAYYGARGGIAIGIGALLAEASPWVLKLMRGVR
jgi:hypothetical protein